MTVEKDYKGFIRVETLHLIPRSLVNFSIFIARNDRLLLYKPANDYITEEQIERMYNMGARFLYVEEEEKGDLYDYYESNIDLLMKSPVIETNKKLTILRSVSEHIMERSFQKPEVKTQFSRWRKNISDNFNFILDNQEIFSRMIVIAEKDSYTYTHSVNVCLMMMGFAIDSGIQDDKTIKDIGLGGMLHDLGKAMIPETIIKKPGPLSQQEWELMQKHPEDGSKLFINHDLASEQTLQIIHQHHESFVGSGYPEHLRGPQIDYWARVAKVIDVYDAITSNRPYQKASQPYQALKEMIAMDSFDRIILTQFINFLNINRMERLKDKFYLMSTPV